MNFSKIESFDYSIEQIAFKKEFSTLLVDLSLVKEIEILVNRLLADSVINGKTPLSIEIRTSNDEIFLKAKGVSNITPQSVMKQLIKIDLTE